MKDKLVFSYWHNCSIATCKIDHKNLAPLFHSHRYNCSKVAGTTVQQSLVQLFNACRIIQQLLVQLFSNHSHDCSTKSLTQLFKSHWQKLFGSCWHIFSAVISTIVQQSLVCLCNGTIA